jgi:hypothetical protein
MLKQKGQNEKRTTCIMLFCSIHHMLAKLKNKPIKGKNQSNKNKINKKNSSNQKKKKLPIISIILDNIIVRILLTLAIAFWGLPRSSLFFYHSLFLHHRCLFLHTDV